MSSAGHHPRCPAPFEPCRCALLWAVEGSAVDDLDDAYRRIYDPDYDGSGSADRPGHYAESEWDRDGEAP